MCKDFDATKNTDLSESIIEAYGTRQGLAEVLSMGIELLHYIEPNTVEQRDIQNVASAIRTACEVLRQGN